MCTYLSKRGSTYYYRRKTPQEYIWLFGSEVVKSLGTKDRRQAEVLVRKMATHYDNLFVMVRDGTYLEEPSPTPQAEEITRPALAMGLGIEDTNLYAARFLQKLKVGRQRAANEGVLSIYYEYLELMVDNAEKFITTGVHPLDKVPSPMWEYEAQIRAIKAMRENRDIAIPEAAVVQASAPASHSTSNLLMDVLTKWASERKPRQQSVDKMRKVILRLEEITGVNDLTVLTRLHVVKFKDGLLAEGLTPVNVNQYLTELKTLLNYAIKQALIDNNPATGMSIIVRESAKDKRFPFSLAALQKIFTSPVYSVADRPIGGKGEAAYWLPLLALYTGARLEELCQLTTRDIYEDSYLDEEDRPVSVWVFELTDEGEGQKLKTAGSRRRVPIHKDLLELGFIAYLQALDEGQVFPELRPTGKDKKLSPNWSKWFGRYLREVIKVSDKRMVFHSMRHTFKDYARAAGIPSDVHNAITGHSSGNVADDYGSDKYPLRPLVEAMEKYKVPGLILPRKSMTH